MVLHDLKMRSILCESAERGWEVRIFIVSLLSKFSSELLTELHWNYKVHPPPPSINTKEDFWQSIPCLQMLFIIMICSCLLVSIVSISIPSGRTDVTSSNMKLRSYFPSKLVSGGIFRDWRSLPANTGGFKSMATMRTFPDCFGFSSLALPPYRHFYLRLVRVPLLSGLRHVTASFSRLKQKRRGRKDVFFLWVHKAAFPVSHWEWKKEQQALDG